MTLSDEELQKVYAWVDEVPLSRPKRNIARDFSDGEIVAHYHPRLVELHNYPGCSSVQQKVLNWNTLNQKVLRRLNCQLSKPQVEDLVNCKAGEIEAFLSRLQLKLAQYKPRKTSGERPAIADADGSFSAREEPQEQNNPDLSTLSSRYEYSSIQDDRSASRGDFSVIVEKDQEIKDLQDTVRILELKVSKLEQLLRIKEAKIEALSSRLQANQPTHGRA